MGERLLSEALEALSPSVGGDMGQVSKEQAHLGLGERAERDESEQEQEVRRGAKSPYGLVVSLRTGSGSGR